MTPDETVESPERQCSSSIDSREQTTSFPPSTKESQYHSHGTKQTSECFRSRSACWLVALRLILVFLLAALAFALGYVFFTTSRKSQVDQFESTYDAITTRLGIELEVRDICSSKYN